MQRVPHVGVHDVLLVLGVALKRIQRQLARLLHHGVGVADHEQRADGPPLPPLHTDGDGQLDQGVHHACRDPLRLQETKRPLPVLRADRDHQDRVRVGGGLARQEADHDVTLFVDPARDPAHQGDLEFLGPAEVVVGQRQHRHARGLDHVALVLADHRLHQPLAGARFAAKKLLGERQIADVQQMVDAGAGGERHRRADHVGLGGRGGFGHIRRSSGAHATLKLEGSE